mgnify:CR=1 FL=1
MFINEELQNHLETSPTIRSQSAVIAEWNMNIPTNILHIANPSNGIFTIMFTLLKSTELGIEVTDLTGKVVYSQPKQKTTDGHQEIELQLQNLNAGIYFCNLRTSEGTVSQKISIVK